jgi:hypothetical protein
MCDFSLETVKSRPAKVGDKLTSHTFSGGTRGFCAPEDHEMAVCLLPGTELSFAEDVWEWPMPPWSPKVVSCRTAIFRQINKERASIHHDALEFPNGKIVLVTALRPGQQATVLQLPATHQHNERKSQLRRRRGRNSDALTT